MNDESKEWGYFLGAYKFSTKPVVRRAVAAAIESLLAALDQAEEDDPYLRETLRMAASDAFANAINTYPNAREVVWVQEEPRNQGAWYWLASRQHLINVLGEKRRLLLVSRPAAASPAVGYLAKHVEQQKFIIDHAFGPIQDTMPQSPN